MHLLDHLNNIITGFEALVVPPQPLCWAVAAVLRVNYLQELLALAQGHRCQHSFPSSEQLQHLAGVATLGGVQGSGAKLCAGLG